MLDMMMGTPAEAGALALAQGIDYVAICRGNPETKNFTKLAPNGLMASLVDNRVPSWLAMDPASKGTPIEIFRVVK